MLLLGCGLVCCGIELPLDPVPDPDGSPPDPPEPDDPPPDPPDPCDPPPTIMPGASEHSSKIKSR